MTRLVAPLERAALVVRESDGVDRLFGQMISASGTWMHAVGLGLLVLSDWLHGNGFNVGVVTALQFLPMLLLSKRLTSSSTRSAGAPPGRANRAI
jgi:hypothetical protein